MQRKDIERISNEQCPQQSVSLAKPGLQSGDFHIQLHQFSFVQHIPSWLLKCLGERPWPGTEQTKFFFDSVQLLIRLS